MLMRLIDMLKTQGITTIFTSLTRGVQLEQTDSAISSLMDTWMLLRDIEAASERNRGIYVLKCRGMAHSNQMREFVLTGNGIELLDVSLLGGGFHMGASRVENELRERAAMAARRLEPGRAEQASRRKKLLLEGQLAALKVELECRGRRLPRRRLTEQADHDQQDAVDLARLAKARKSESSPRKSGRCAPCTFCASPSAARDAREILREKAEPMNQKPVDQTEAEQWNLRLYVAGRPRSLRAFANLKKICEEHLKGQYSIEVIDL